MPSLYPSPATLAAAEVNMKLDSLYLGLGDLGLILLLDLGFFQFAAAVWTAVRQFRFQALVKLLRNRAPTTATIPGPRFPPRLSRMGFGSAPRERRRLSLPARCASSSARCNSAPGAPSAQ